MGVAAEPLELLVDELVRRDCQESPAALLDRVECVDSKTGEQFQFELVDHAGGWFWQRDVLDWWLSTDKSVVLKARQLGITWLAGGLALWNLLYKPGSRCLVVSINEEEAAKVVNRIWDMLESLPVYLRNSVQVLKPSRGARPHTSIEVKHLDGRVSAVLGLPSTKKAGHGETAALVILDEFARQEYARETWKAVLPTAAGGGKILVISTANGVSNEATGAGNFFHHLWANSEPYGIAQKFLRWDLHPDRDDKWYRANAMALPAKDRAEQYPANENEAFILTGDAYFDLEALSFYAENAVSEELYTGKWVSHTPGRAKFERGNGWVTVYQEPQEDRLYAIGADTATGKGADYSSATVVDLSSMTVVAHIHGKIDADLYAEQLHYTGRWYNTALIAIESAGGYGEAPTIFLRDGKNYRPAYPKLYQHRQFSRSDLQQHKPYGFPMNTKTRPLVLGYLERALREHLIPAMPRQHLHECQTFVHAETNPSPRAQEGCNDDRVFSLALALEMFRQFGEHPERPRKTKRKKKPLYPWETP